MSYEDQSHRFVITGEDPDGHPRTIILWRETDLVDGKVVRRVHVTRDAATVTETILTRYEAVVVTLGESLGDVVSADRAVAVRLADLDALVGQRGFEVGEAGQLVTSRSVCLDAAGLGRQARGTYPAR